MAIRGVYDKVEEEMIAADNKNADIQVGWGAYPNRVATLESMKSFARLADEWNPLWSDEDYALRTRWGGITAVPTYVGSFTPMLPPPEAPPEYGYQHFWWVGEDWEFFRPVHVNDSFRIWQRRPQSKDVTPLDGKGPRTFSRLLEDHDHINQRDELVSTIRFYEQRSFLPGGPPKPYSMPEYGYTKEELEFIIRTIKEEEIHGANIRYWEDVSIGEETKPTVLGPTNIQTAFAIYGTMGTITREVLLEGQVDAFIRDAVMLCSNQLAFLKDPDTSLLYTHAGSHYSNRAAQAVGDPLAYLAGASSKFNMLRAVTNWMGDDGFVRKFNWRHIHRIPLGDTIIGRGKVTNKHVTNGEHLVDLVVWGRNMRGHVTEAATATVRLISKEDPYPPIIK
jgi:acyl dehydratase